MKRYYAVISLWISVVLFPNVAVARNIVNNLSDDKLSQSSRIINPRLERISERLSGKLESRFQSSYRGVLPSEYRIWNHKPFLGMDTKFQPEDNIKNYYYITTSEATVYDDNGRPITEEEIKAYMISDYKPGCCLLGGLVGSGASFLLGCAAGIYMVDFYEEELNLDGHVAITATWLAIWGVGTGVSTTLGSKAGEEIDRRKAIELIKKERRTGRKQPQQKRKFLPSVVISLGAGGATVLIIGLLEGWW